MNVPDMTDSVGRGPAPKAWLSGSLRNPRSRSVWVVVLTYLFIAAGSGLVAGMVE